MVRSAPCSMFFSGCWLACLIFHAKLTQPVSWCLCKSLMNLWSMKICATLCRSTEICRLSSVLFIRTWKTCVLKAWIPTNLRRRLPNLSRKKSSCLLRSTISRIKVTVKTSKLSLRQPQSSVKNRSKTLVSTKRNVSWPKLSSLTSTSASPYVNVLWTLRKYHAKTLAPSRCWTTYVTRLGKTARFATMFLVESLMTSASASSVSKCCFRNLKRHRANLNVWLPMWSVCSAMLEILIPRSVRMRLLMISLRSTSRRLTQFQRRKMLNLKSFAKLRSRRSRWRSSFARRKKPTRRCVVLST